MTGAVRPRKREAILGRLTLVVVVIAFVICATAVVGAQVPPAVDWLMHDPISMFDEGIFRARAHMWRAVAELNAQMQHAYEYDTDERHPDRPYRTSVSNYEKLKQFGYKYDLASAEYDFDQRQIQLGISVSPGGPSMPGDNRSEEQKVNPEACADIVDDVRAAIFVSGLVGAPSSDAREREEQVRKVLDSWFSHAGFRRSNEPKNLALQLAKVTFIIVHLHSVSAMEGPSSRDQDCSARLVGGPVTFTMKRERQDAPHRTLKPPQGQGAAK